MATKNAPKVVLDPTQKQALDRLTSAASDILRLQNKDIEKMMDFLESVPETDSNKRGVSILVEDLLSVILDQMESP
jgi:hypothetical protein